MKERRGRGSRKENVVEGRWMGIEENGDETIFVGIKEDENEGTCLRERADNKYSAGW